MLRASFLKRGLLLLKSSIPNRYPGVGRFCRIAGPPIDISYRTSHTIQGD